MYHTSHRWSRDAFGNCAGTSVKHQASGRPALTAEGVRFGGEVLANQALADHEQALVLQQLTVLQKDFATLRPQCFWLYLNFPVALQGATCWNRRHLDVMIRSSRVQFPLSPICESFVLLRHQLSRHFLTDALNSYFEQAGVPHFRLLHLPLLWDRQQLLQEFEHEGLIPLDFRPQLSRGLNFEDVFKLLHLNVPTQVAVL